MHGVYFFSNKNSISTLLSRPTAHYKGKKSAKILGDIMVIFIVLFSIWALLLIRTIFVEYKYYQLVKTLEPEVWQQLGAPKFIKIPIVFVSPKGVKILKTVTHPKACHYAIKHRQAGVQFLFYVVLVLVVSTLYFKLA